MLEINNPDVKREVQEVFSRYEKALVSNDVETLDSAFWESPHAIRYGVNENLYGYEEVMQFRASRPPINLARELQRTEITTFGHDMATVNTLFRREGGDKIGRQSQVWVRFPEGWKIVSAHVSLMLTK